MATINTTLSLVRSGDLSRFFAVLRKAQRGEPIRVAGLGGSITGGATATDAAHRWLNLSSLWFYAHYGVDVISHLVNAGIGSTESPFGALRVDVEVLRYAPDLVFLDYSVNNEDSDADSYDSLLRKLIKANPAICVIPVMFCNAIGQGDYATLQPICVKYDLPIISYREVIQDYLNQGGASTTYSDDTVHPNNAGHQVASDCIQYCFDQFDTAFAGIAAPIIAPPTDNTFEDTAFIERTALDTANLSGFVYNNITAAQHADTAGQWVEYDINVGGGGNVWLVVRISNVATNGTITTQIDGSTIGVISTYSATWTFDKAETFLVATGVAPGRHKLRLTAGDGASGATVDIYGVGYTIDAKANSFH